MYGCQGLQHALVVEFEAHPEDRVPNLVFPLADVEEGLAEIATKIEVGPRVGRLGSLVPAVVQPLTQLPAALPRLLVRVGRP